MQEADSTSGESDPFDEPANHLAPASAPKFKQFEWLDYLLVGICVGMMGMALYLALFYGGRL